MSALLSERVRKWLDDESASSGNPFARLARSVMLGTRLNELVNHLDGTASQHDADEIDYERADGSKKNIDAASDDVADALNDLDDATGSLSTLTTTIKTSIVAAINEIVSGATSMAADYRAQFAEMLMDQTSPPTSTAGRGQVDGTGNELLIEAQAVPDLTVRAQLGGNTINHRGERNAVGIIAALGGFAIPAGAGDQRKDIVVIAADGTPAVRSGAEVAPPAASPALTAGDVPLAEIVLTEGVDTDIQAANITDLRSRLGAEALQIAYDASGDETSGPDLQTSVNEIALAGLVLMRKSITTADLTDAALSQSINFDSDIPAKAIVLGSWFDLDEVFAGGGASAATVDMGDGVDADGYVDNEDVFTGATLGQRTTPTTNPALLLGSGVDLDDGARTPAILLTSDVNVDQLTTGQLTGFILYSATPLGAVVA